MPSRWFNLPDTGTGTLNDPYRPKLFGYSVEGWAGNKQNPQKWVVRVFADSSTLNSLAAEPQATSFGDVPTQALNNMFGQNRNENGWENGFNIQ
jgi:hypothetical protein